MFLFYYLKKEIFSFQFNWIYNGIKNNLIVECKNKQYDKNTVIRLYL